MLPPTWCPPTSGPLFPGYYHWQGIGTNLDAITANINRLTNDRPLGYCLQVSARSSAAPDAVCS
jgi:hypothetical protein